MEIGIIQSFKSCEEIYIKGKYIGRSPKDFKISVDFTTFLDIVASTIAMHIIML